MNQSCAYGKWETDLRDDMQPWSGDTIRRCQQLTSSRILTDKDLWTSWDALQIVMDEGHTSYLCTRWFNANDGRSEGVGGEEGREGGTPVKSRLITHGIWLQIIWRVVYDQRIWPIPGDRPLAFTNRHWVLFLLLVHRSPIRQNHCSWPCSWYLDYRSWLFTSVP